MSIFKKIIKIFFHYLPLYIVKIISFPFPDISLFYRIRGILYKPFFKKCGHGLLIARGVTLLGIENISIGDNVYFAKNVWINGSGGLSIGNGCIFSPNVVIATSKHDIVDGKVSIHSSYMPISIGNYVWIASNSVIARGVSIGDNCIISALSFVNHDFESNLFLGGSPAKIIKELANEKKTD